MQVDEATDVPACLPSAQFLSAEELVSLRKPSEETPQLVIGERLYTRSESLVVENAVKCALDSYKETLDEKRAGKICDLIQAEWNPELNIVTVPKLKGKFGQHMGRLVNGQLVLAPEEALFLLENNHIEIMNGKIPMSTEEAYNMILKGNLGPEKYQVYSHFCKLGYIIVPHQSEVGVPDYEKEMNLDEIPLKRKQLFKEPAEGEPEKKRLTFTGALLEGSEMKTTSDASEEKSATSVEEARILEGSEHDIVNKSSDNVKHIPHNIEQNGDGAIIDKGTEDIQSDIDKINRTSENNCELEARHENKDNEVSEEINLPADSKSVEEKENVPATGENTKSNGMNSQNLNEVAENSKLQKDFSLKDNESQDFLDSNSQSSKIVDVMDVDTDAETSCSTSEVSRENFGTYFHATSQDSCISVNNDEKTQGDVNPDSNFDVLSMSGSSSMDEEEEVLTIDAGSTENPAREDDDDVTLLEVTKKETKPLAIIDLLSDDDDDENETVDVVDDDITFLEEYPSSSMGRPTSSREINSKKLNGCKKEEKGVIVSSSKLIPPLTVQLPDLFRKRVVCIARPPLYLLPNHVRPSKEAYVLNLKTKNPDQPSLNNRVWNSFRDMQDYQRQRRQNRHQNHNPRGQPFSGPQTWNDRNSRYDRSHRPGFGPNRVNSPDVNSNSRGFLGPPSVDFNRNSFSVNSFQNNLPSSNPTTMNCEVTIKEDTSESLVGNGNQSSHSNNFSFSSGMPNNPLMNPLIPNNFMAGIQRNSFSMGNVSHTHLMAELQRTCFTVATNVLSSMLNRNPSLLPNPTMPTFPPGFDPFTLPMTNDYNNSYNLLSSGEYLTIPHQNFSDQQRRFHRSRPFPCRYRNVGNKRSWSDVRSAVCDSSSDSDIEEMPISPREILWESKDICPQVRPAVRYPEANVLKFLHCTQKAKIACKYGYPTKLIQPVTILEISFDVYPPAFIYRKTCPQIPKYRIVVLRSTDPIPKCADLAILQSKWNDGASFLIAINDNGDISFHSFNSVSVPMTISRVD